MLSRFHWGTFIGLFAGFLCGCASRQPFYAPTETNWAATVLPDTSQLAYTAFLIGDAGSPDPNEPTLKLLDQQLHASSAQARSAIFYLGDNIYPVGMPAEQAPTRRAMERRVNTQLDILKGYRGRRFMIPGNHDWGQGKADGLQRNAYEEAYVERYLQTIAPLSNADAYVPSDGCPGPFEIRATPDLVVIAINSQWFLHRYERPFGPNSPCDVPDEGAFFRRLDTLLARHRGQQVLVVAHHPILSAGAHGGYFPLTDHLFPLRILRKWAWVPLPAVGSLYPLGRRRGISTQDIAHPAYQAYKAGLEAVFARHPHVVYATGHEHTLQYLPGNGYHHVVSGAGCKTEPVGQRGAGFTAQTRGFARINYYRNGATWVEFWTPTDDGATGRVLFRKELIRRP
jgi:hypothetical protein